MSKRPVIFDVEPSSDIIAAIPEGVISADLSASARLILLLVFTHSGKPSKAFLMEKSRIRSDKTWQKVALELVHKGWLVRENHGGAGRGQWLHERTFLRVPRKNPML